MFPVASPYMRDLSFPNSYHPNNLRRVAPLDAHAVFDMHLAFSLENTLAELGPSSYLGYELPSVSGRQMGSMLPRKDVESPDVRKCDQSC